MLGLKARQPFIVKLNTLFPSLFNRAESPDAPPVQCGGCLPLWHRAPRRDELGARTPGEVGPPARGAPPASVSRSGPAPPLQGRGNPVGAGWEGNAVGHRLLQYSSASKQRVPTFPPGSCDFQRPCGILKQSTWIFPQTRLGYFRR